MFIGDEKFQQKLKIVFQFEVLPDGTLPNEVCRKCTTIITEFFKYSDKVQSNQERLLSERALNFNGHHSFESLSVAELALDTNEHHELKQELLVIKQEPHCEEIEGKHSLTSTPVEQQANIFTEYPAVDNTSPSSDAPDDQTAQCFEDEGETPNLNSEVEKPAPTKEATSEADIRLLDSFHLGCELCTFLPQRFRDLYIHYRKEHNIAGYVRCCGRRFRRRSLALEHVDAHKGLIRCEVCNKTYTTYFALKMHTLNRHGDPEAKKYKCGQCKQSFLQLSVYNSHKKSHTKVRCKICEKTLASINSLKVHMETKHGNQPKLICPTCGIELCTKYAMDRHINSHMGIETIERLQCNLCLKWFNGKPNLKTHIRRMHEETDVSQCEICQHVSPNNYSLRNHINRVHRTGKRFDCEYCGKQLKTKLNLREHVATHTGTPLYVCEICNATFKSSANRYSHIKARHPVEWKAQKELKALQKAGKTAETL
ncbi:transcription factor grauzone-like [Anopheles ziemanni]|nr:transcription factor grauzone-like [Anopheles ziemanni]